MKSVVINDNLMTYVEAGDPKRPTLMLLTGWAQDNRLFKNVVPHLAAQYHVLSPDWRGHNPDHQLTGDFGTSDLADDVIKFADALGVDEFHIVSHSHGCWVNIEVCERLGAARLDKTVIIDWLLQPHEGFMRQVQEGRDPARYEAARKSMFDEWASSTDNKDVLNHIYNEMPSFGGEMWMRANREIEIAYTKWGNPLRRMESLHHKPRVLHVYSQPLSEAYRQMQNEYAMRMPWFKPAHLPGKTHFPSLENGKGVADSVLAFFAD